MDIVIGKKYSLIELENISKIENGVFVADSYFPRIKLKKTFVEVGTQTRTNKNILA